MRVYVVSHNRSTLPFCLQAISQQTENVIPCVYNYVESKDASNDMVKHADSAFFLRVDDDMYLHKAALAYVKRVCEQNKESPMIAFKLYDTAIETEDWCGTVKAYNTAFCRNYTFEDPGDWSMDVRFMAYLQQNSLQFIMDDSVLGLHANIPQRENSIYLRNALQRYPKLVDYGGYKFSPAVLAFDSSVAKQYEAGNRLVTRVNKQNDTNFSRYMGD